MPSKTDPYLLQVLAEQNQGFATRRRLLGRLGNLLKLPVVSLYTAFNQPVDLENADADMLEGILQKMDLKRGLALVLNSPGGDGMAAERIINICRSYSGTGQFVAVVPGKAKSAATLICFGAAKILMGRSSELGPVDPQVLVGNKRFAAHEIIESYENLFASAVKTKGNLEPFLLQLQNYDPRDIRRHRSYVSLSTDIAVRSLSSGMMKGKTFAQIEKKIKVFLVPAHTKAHARAIFRSEVKACDLTVDDLEPKFHEVASELHVRSSNFVTAHASKCIETERNSWVARVVPWSQQP